MRRSHARRFPWVPSLVVLLVVTGLFVVTRQRAAEQHVPAPHFWADPSIRSVVITKRVESVAKKGDILVAELVAGHLPPQTRTATVLTDSNCTPDPVGISHCLNEMAVGAAKVTVRHHHDMRTVPCLSPGETVNILDPATYKAVPASS